MTSAYNWRAYSNGLDVCICSFSVTNWMAAVILMCRACFAEVGALVHFLCFLENKLDKLHTLDLRDNNIGIQSLQVNCSPFP